MKKLAESFLFMFFENSKGKKLIFVSEHQNSEKLRKYCNKVAESVKRKKGKIMSGIEFNSNSEACRVLPFKKEEIELIKEE